MKIYNFFSVGTVDFIQLAKLVFFQLKQTKTKDSIYNYYLALDTDNIEQYIPQFIHFLSEDFNIILIPAAQYKNIIIPQNRITSLSVMSLPYITYLKCIIPTLFPNLDKILYLDLDIAICQQGIEKLFDINFEDNYLLGVVDPIIQVFNILEEKDRIKTKKYFNSGVLMWNISKIIQNKIDKKLLDAVTGNWPEDIINPNFHDQTLLNFIFKNKIKEISPIYNNIMCNAVYEDIPSLINIYKHHNINNMEDIIKNVVILHFAGYKPWLPTDDFFFKERPYFYFNTQIWKYINASYKEIFNIKK